MERAGTALERQTCPNQADPITEDSMAAKPLPDADLLRQLLRYEPDTGKLFWKERNASHFPPSKHAATFARTFNNELSGKEAFTAQDERGYHQGWIKGQRYKAHRIIWKIVTGEDPITIDHINGATNDNRWLNLRNATTKENGRNRKISVNNTSGVCGVGWVAECNKWSAAIKIDNRTIHLGFFLKFEDARDARLKAERDAGFHPNHGRKQVR